MPHDEEGAKWSCEPCIRGHRSSKCQHFDRLMMKVPKAGRPLAKCPHPKGTCSCQKLYAFMIRIPKGSTCLCRPVYQVPVDGNQSPSTTSPPAFPASTPASTPGKIQKASKRQIKAPSENLVKALDAIPHFGSYSVENGASHRPTYLQDPGSGPSHDTLGQSVAAPGPFMPQNQALATGESLAPKPGGCCSSRAPKPSTQTSTPGSGATSASGSTCGSRSASGSGSGSCCKKPEPQIKMDSGNDTTASPYFAASSSPYPTVSHTPVPNWEDFQGVDTTSFMPSFSVPHTPAGPPNYVADYMPHASAGPSLGFHDPNMPSSNGFDHSTTPQAVPDPAAGFPQTVSAAFDGSPIHTCDCGDECQCLGCATHPFNTTTKEHVREMGLMVALDGTPQNANGLDAYHNVPLPMNQQDSQSEEYLYGNFGQHVNMTTPYSEQVPASGDPTNGFSSPPADFSQPMMHTSEYYTLEYPVRFQPACSDVTGSCQCGSDCQCVGCLTHNGHNGIALEPDPTETHGLGLSQSDMSACGPSLDTSGLPHFNHASGTPSSSSML